MKTFDDFVTHLGELSTPLSDIIDEMAERWPTGAPPTMLLSRLAKQLVAEAPSTSAKVIDSIAAEIEDILRDGEDGLKDIVATGFLEAIAAETHRREPDESIVTKLGPHAQAYLAAWSDFTG